MRYINPGKQPYMLLLIFMIAAALLLSCNSAHQHQEPEKETTVVAKLELNDGVKWNADESTNTNVSALIGILDSFTLQPERSLEAHHQAAGSLQIALNKLVKDCEMKGPDHDALHLWLEPVMDEVSALKKSTSAEQAAGHFSTLREQASLYREYFE